MRFLRSIAVLLAGMFRRRRERAEIDEARRFLASLDSFCREWCLGQEHNGRGDDQDDGREPWATDPDAWKKGIQA